MTSDTLTVSRTPGTTAAVTVDIGALLALPSDHAGYALVKSADLPIEVIAAPSDADVCDRTVQVRDAIVEAISGVIACGDVTAEHLAAIGILNLRSKDIKALKAGDFSGLTILKELNLSDNHLSSLDADIFSNLTALELLSLHNNRLSTLDADIFSNLTALKRLNLSYNQLSSLDASTFSNLAALKTLYLQRNQLSSLDANIFSNLTALKWLDLTNNQLSSLDADIFSNLAALETLYLYNNHLSSLDADIFSNLTALIRLDLANNQLSALDADIFSNLTALELLSLFNNHLSSLDADIFSNLAALETLYLYNNHLSSLDAGIFSNLAALKALYLHRNHLSSLDAGIFSGLTALKTLYLQFNSVDPLPIILSLELVEEGQFKASAHTGAPFEIIVPITVTNGSIDGGATTITIPIGRVDSDSLSVSRTDGITAAVAVDIGELPSLPRDVDLANNRRHQGYTLIKSADLPLKAIAALLTFSEGTSTTRSFAENTAAGENIGNPITATDPDGGTLTYSLEGTDADSFTIVSTSGQLQTKADVTYNYEVKTSYSVTVKVVDSQGGSATVDVTITLTDVDEPPAKPAAPTVAAIDGSPTSLTVSWTVPANTGPAITDYDVQYRAGNSGSFTDANYDGIDLSTTLTGLTPNTGYEVQVRAKNEEGTSAWSDSGSGMTTAIGICDRTVQVRDAIVEAISGVSACGDVTAEHLAAIGILNLRSKGIKALKAGDFSGLTALNTLFLSDNHLSTLDADIIANLTALEILQLSGNQLNTLDASIFSNLTELKALLLSGNHLGTLDADIFSNLTVLKTLNLHNNRLDTLDAGIFFQSDGTGISLFR